MRLRPPHPADLLYGGGLAVIVAAALWPVHWGPGLASLGLLSLFLLSLWLASRQRGQRRGLDLTILATSLTSIPALYNGSQPDSGLGLSYAALFGLALCFLGHDLSRMDQDTPLEFWLRRAAGGMVRFLPLLIFPLLPRLHNTPGFAILAGLALAASLLLGRLLLRNRSDRP